MAKKTTQTPADLLAAALVPKEAQPYEIPANWRWVKLGSINQYDGDNIEPSAKPEEIFELYSVPSYADKYPEIIAGAEIGSSKKIVKKDDVLLCKINPRINRVWKVEQYTDHALIASSEWIIFRNEKINAEYLMRYFQSPVFREYMLSNVSGVGGSLMRAKPKYVDTYPVPLPPLAEQARIVARIETLFAQIDEAEEKLRAAEGTFAARRAAILQSALRGKLISHSNTGENAESLYQAIQKKKEELIADKKLKREKPLSPIADKEKPFEIPSNWKWVRLGDIFNLQAGKNITSADIVDEKDNEHPYACYGGNGLRGYVATYNREGSYALIGRQGAYCGNVQFAVGKFYATEHAVVVDTFEMTNVEWSRLFLSALNLNQYSTATAQPGLAVSKIVNCLIPLPPLDEQREIVRLLDDAFAEEERARQALEAARAAIPALRRAILARAFRGALGTGDPAEPPADLSAAR